MNVFQKVASNTEIRTVALVEEAIESETGLNHGRATFRCHIVAEVHTGVWVGSHTHGRTWLGVYRCQDHFWGAILDKGRVEAAKAAANLSPKAQPERAIELEYMPLDLGLMSQGTKALAEKLGKLDYTGVSDR